MFFYDITGSFERFQLFSFKTNFLKKLEYHFLIESTQIENVTFPYKTPLPEANVKTNRMESINRKDRSFASNDFIFS